MKKQILTLVVCLAITSTTAFAATAPVKKAPVKAVPCVAKTAPKAVKSDKVAPVVAPVVKTDKVAPAVKNEQKAVLAPEKSAKKAECGKCHKKFKKFHFCRKAKTQVVPTKTAK